LTSLAKIPYEVTNNPQNEAFYQLYEFIVAAIEYQKYFKPQIFEMQCETEKETTKELNQDFSPLKEQTDRNATKEQYNIANSTQESHRAIRTRNNTSPLGDILSSQETTRTHGNKNMNKSFEKTKKGQYEPMLETNVRDFNTKTSRSNMKYLINERQYTQDEEQETSPEYIAMRAHTVEAEWREISMLDDTIERRSREAREYKSKAQRLLADHERYVSGVLLQES